jgi:hypothetical protein
MLFSSLTVSNIVSQFLFVGVVVMTYWHENLHSAKKYCLRYESDAADDQLFILISWINTTIPTTTVNWIVQNPALELKHLVTSSSNQSWSDIRWPEVQSCLQRSDCTSERHEESTVGHRGVEKTDPRHLHRIQTMTTKVGNNKPPKSLSHVFRPQEPFARMIPSPRHSTFILRTVIQSNSDHAM